MSNTIAVLILGYFSIGAFLAVVNIIANWREGKAYVAKYWIRLFDKFIFTIIMWPLIMCPFKKGRM